jgi:hypothetical protein
MGQETYDFLAMCRAFDEEMGTTVWAQDSGKSRDQHGEEG